MGGGDGIVAYCANNAPVWGGSRVGGIAGKSDGNIVHNKNAAPVNSTWAPAGGVAGAAGLEHSAHIADNHTCDGATVTSCRAAADYEGVGGIVGYVGEATITNNYAGSAHIDASKSVYRVAMPNNDEAPTVIYQNNRARSDMRLTGDNSATFSDPVPQILASDIITPRDQGYGANMAHGEDFDCADQTHPDAGCLYCANDKACGTLAPSQCKGGMPRWVVGAYVGVVNSVASVKNSIARLLKTQKSAACKTLELADAPGEAARGINDMLEGVRHIESSLSQKLCCSASVFSKCEEPGEPACIYFHKRLAVSGQPVKGAVFELNLGDGFASYAPGGDYPRLIESDADGLVHIGYLPYGPYKLTEVRPAPGFVEHPEYHFTVDQSGSVNVTGVSVDGAQMPLDDYVDPSGNILFNTTNNIDIDEIIRDSASRTLGADWPVGAWRKQGEGAIRENIPLMRGAAPPRELDAVCPGSEVTPSQGDCMRCLPTDVAHALAGVVHSVANAENAYSDIMKIQSGYMDKAVRLAADERAFGGGGAAIERLNEIAQSAGDAVRTIGDIEQMQADALCCVMDCIAAKDEPAPPPTTYCADFDKVIEPGDVPAENAYFRVIGTNFPNTLFRTDANGHLRLTHLTPGEYAMAEETPPEGVDEQPVFRFTISENGELTITGVQLNGEEMEIEYYYDSDTNKLINHYPSLPEQG
ncbi:MAG: prealbumin-like fold domain-containing protein [Oscillospiraceae bacterium]|nr:prealbumin-like fold domain-containing protein [Oscillospiraceae bacterium]